MNYINLNKYNLFIVQLGKITIAKMVSSNEIYYEELYLYTSDIT